MDFGCEADTAQPSNRPDDDDIGVFRCDKPVSEVTLKPEKPFTGYNMWAVVGQTAGFRTGNCTQRSTRILECPIDPPMPPGDNTFIVALKGLPIGTKVMLEVESPGARGVQRLTVTTK